MLAVWKAAFFEGIGSMVIVWFSGISTATILSYETKQIGPFVALSTAFIVSLSVYALGPISGGQTSPLITISTLLTGSLSPIRAAAYLFAQMAGACLGGLFVAMALGPRAIPMGNAGCNLVEAQFSINSAASIEFMASFTLLIMAYGTGLAHRPRAVLGVKLAPILTGLTVGSIVFAASSIAPGGIFVGSSGFPTRCFGLAVGIGQIPAYEWVFFLPMIAAAVIHAGVYRLVLPYGPNQTCEEREESKGPPMLPVAEAGGRKAVASLEGVRVVDAAELLLRLREQVGREQNVNPDRLYNPSV